MTTSSSTSSSAMSSAFTSSVVRSLGAASGRSRPAQQAHRLVRIRLPELERGAADVRQHLGIDLGVDVGHFLCSGRCRLLRTLYATAQVLPRVAETGAADYNATCASQHSSPRATRPSDCPESRSPTSEELR